MPKIKFNYKKILLFIACLSPFIYLVYGALTNNLGAEPVDKMLSITGNWILRFLLITLSISRIRKLFKLNLICYRRMLGLFAFFYALIHFLVYITFDQGLIFTDILADIQKRNFILVGVSSFLILLILAITSLKWFMKKLKKKWFALHKSIYPAIALGITHYYMLVKSDVTEPTIYASLFILIVIIDKYADRKRP